MIKNNRTYAVDADEILYNTVIWFLGLFNRKYGTKHKKEDFVKYQWDEILGIEQSQVQEELNGFTHSEWGLNVPLVKGSYEGLKRLNSIYGKVVCVTHRPKEVKERTYQQLDLNFKGLISEVYFCHRYSSVAKPIKKIDILKELEAVALVEDQLPIAKECAEGGIIVKLLDYPWNQTHERLHPNIHRVYSWDEIE